MAFSSINNNHRYQPKSVTGRAVFSLLVLIVLFSACKKEQGPEIIILPANSNADAALKWADMSLYTIRFSSFNSPTYSSRSLGYLGLAMYEAVVNGDATHQSMNGQLNGLTLPATESGKVYDWIICLNWAEADLLKLLYPVPENSHVFVQQRIDSLSSAIDLAEQKNVSAETALRSKLYGKALALAIHNWSVTDGGYHAYAANFDPAFSFPSGDGYWVPPARGQVVSYYPLHPHWGNNRTFVKANASIPIPAIMPFSSDPSSDYYKMYKEIYDKDPLLTLAEREIAAWWGDDPTETFSPPGHSYYIAGLAIKKSNCNLIKATEAYARTGLAVADAFINCWKAKTTYFNQRPSSFVKTYIDPNWVQLWPEPPFPAFPSGHSTQAAAAATVLADIFGDPFPFTDDAHLGHRRYDSPRFMDLVYPARSFNSFWEAAAESGYSRLLGGIHTRQDNEVGLQEGQVVGSQVNTLHWSK